MVKYILLLAFLAHVLVSAFATRGYDSQERPKHARRSPRKTFHCGKYEEWSPCPDAVCRPLTCEEAGFPIPCLDLGPDGKCPSKPRCICKEGFVKNCKGKCIPIEYCPSCGGDSNARPGYGNCNPLCSNYDQDDVVCTEEYNYNGCDCKDGYVLNEVTGKSVLPSQCPPRKKCKKNAYYDLCPPSCPFRTCGIDDRLVRCATPLPVGHPDCPPPACRCKDGFFKNPSGQCVRWKQCPKCNKPNEMFDACLTDCPPRICGFDEALILCPVQPQLGDPQCKSGCRCMDGYSRNATGICIPKEDCPKCTKRHETYDPCPPPCPQPTCKSIGKKQHCPLILEDSNEDSRECIGQCVCEEGYYRNDMGECVTKEDCPPQCGKFEFYSTCTQGNCSPQKCSQVGFPISCPRIDPKYCKKGCLCQEGYARNDKGICVPTSKCPLRCPANEEPSDCINGGCQPRNCSQYGKPVPCVKMDPKYCIKGCVCKEKYLRDYNGQCVPEDQCPEACNGPNEEYSKCSWNCPPQTCDSLGKAYACPIREEDKCKPMCRCKSGYYRNKIGQCISEEECKRCGEHAYFSCGGACDNVCKTLDRQSKDNCPIINIQCNKMCYCEDGYARARNNTCIPIDFCDGKHREETCVSEKEKENPSKTCEVPNPHLASVVDYGLHPPAWGRPVPSSGTLWVDYADDNRNCYKNEVYEDCSNPVCKPRFCTDLGFPLNCKAKCKKGCFCKDGYVRNSRGRCIPQNKCPSCGGDKNARLGCGTNCGRRCPNNYINPKFCPKIACVPQLNKCDCRDGFFYDINTKSCVKFEDCSPRCDEKKYEEFDSCINGGCGWRNCSQVGGPILCIDPIECKKGCKCKDGYYRLDDGTCVPKDQCPVKCKGPNEIFTCGPACDNVCSKLETESKENCPIKNKKCELKCYCRDGYARNKKGICIPIDKCPLKCEGPNEIFACGTACDNVCGKLETESKYDCPIMTLKCVPKCYCQDGYARDEKGICIPIDKCPCTDIYSSQTTTTCKPTSTPIFIDNAIAKFERGNQAFAGKLLYLMRESRPGENFMISGFSILVALAQLALNAVGVALEQFLQLLYLDSVYQIEAIMPELIKKYKAQQEVIFKLRVKYYSNIDYPFSDEFTEKSYAVFESDVQSIDFAQNKQAANTINDWVYENTNGLIKDLVTADMFSRDTRCALVNVLYFLGNWQKQFNKDNTQARNFYIDEDTTVQLDTMYQQGKFEYAESDDLGCQILKLPYKGGNFSFTILLPKEKFGLNSLIEKLQDVDAFAKIPETLNTETCNVYLPSMDFDTNISDLRNLLQKVGLTEPFKPNSNGFEGILKNDEPLFISDAIQKTKIKVDEKGTEAAAATGVVVGVTSIIYPEPKIYTVNCNRPFVFILHLESFPMFYGVFSGRK